MAKKNKHPKTLAEFFGVDKVGFNQIDLSEFAHVVIDVQGNYCDPKNRENRGTKHTKQRAKKIAHVMPAFRKTGMQTVIVYFDDSDQGFDNAKGGPYKIKRKKNDILVPKWCNSAFQGSNIHATLQEKDISKLLISGFNGRACVRYTVLDALKKKYQVALLKDCIGDDQYLHNETSDEIKQMAIKGAIRTTSHDALLFAQMINAHS